MDIEPEEFTAWRFFKDGLSCRQIAQRLKVPERIVSRMVLLADLEMGTSKTEHLLAVPQDPQKLESLLRALFDDQKYPHSTP